MAARASFHQQLIEKLRKLLRSRQFAPGAKFLTEREIAERFETSRPTANKALSSLVSAGLLEIRHGAGTFVRESVLDYDLERLVSFTDKAKASGKKPGTDLIEFRKVIAADVDPHIASQLRVSPEASLFYMERIRLADGTPVIFERRHVVAAHCPALAKADAKGSLYAAWTTKCRLQITGADESIRAVNSTAAHARHLKVRPGTACFQITAVGFIKDEEPLWHEETLYRADVYEFRNRIGGLGAAVGRMVEEPRR